MAYGLWLTTPTTHPLESNSLLYPRLRTVRDLIAGRDRRFSFDRAIPAHQTRRRIPEHLRRLTLDLLRGVRQRVSSESRVQGPVSQHSVALQVLLIRLAADDPSGRVLPALSYLQ